MGISHSIKTIILAFRLPFFWLKGNKLSVNSDIKKNVLLRECFVGPYVHIGPNSIINNTFIGSYSSIAPHVQIGGMEHPYWEPSTSTYLSTCVKRERTIVGNDVWIGAAVIIKAGVKIGNGAVIGANSFVNKDVPPYAIVVGAPAKILKYRFGEETIAALEKSHYWELKPTEAKKIISEISINRE